MSSRRNCCDATEGNRWWGRETISKDAYTKKQTIEHQNFAPEDIPHQFIGRHNFDHSITESLMVCFIRICVETLSAILTRHIDYHTFTFADKGENVLVS